jgi:hypothetical protein
MAGQVRKPPALALGLLACSALAALSLVLLPSGPTYDPYAWLIWGRDLAHLHLATGGSGTTWKPLPALVDALLSPLGRAQPSGWLLVARAGALFGCFMAGRLAWRICGPRWGVVAAPVAAVTLLLGYEYLTRAAVGESEGVMAGVGLLAIDRHLSARYGQALAAGFAAALLRPESWPFVGLYAAYLWLAPRRPSRLLIATAGLLVPVLWFGADWVGSGSLWTGPHLALHSMRATWAGRAADPFAAVMREAVQIVPGPARLAAPVAIVVAALAIVRARRGGRRADPAHRLTLVLGAGVVAWTGIVAGMAVRGYPGLYRFLFMALAVTAVLAGVGAARIGQGIAAGLRFVRLRRVAPAAVAVSLVVLAALAAPDVARLRGDAESVGALAVKDDGIAEAARVAGGGSAVLRCGTPVAPWWSVTALAYDLGLQSSAIHTKPVGRRPVLFTRTSARARHGLRVEDRIDGWKIVDRCRREL